MERFRDIGTRKLDDELLALSRIVASVPSLESRCRGADKNFVVKGVAGREGTKSLSYVGSRLLLKEMRFIVDLV